MTDDEQVELEMLRKSAHRFITNPLEKVFFELETLLEQQQNGFIDSKMPTKSFRVLARALILLKDELIK